MHRPNPMPSARHPSGKVGLSNSVAFGMLGVRILVVLAAVGAAAANARASDRAATAHLDVRLISDHASFAPGHPIDAGFEFELAEGWHIYWRNPGDSGEPPRVAWSLPGGFSAGEIEWPVPERIRVGPLLDYGYSKRVVLPVRISVPFDLERGTTIPLKADSRWLACRAERCIPGRAQLILDLPVAESAALDERSAKLLREAREQLPKALEASVETPWAGVGEKSLGGERVALRLHDVSAPPGAEVNFFPLQTGVIKDAIGRIGPAGADELRIELERGELARPGVDRVTGLVIVDSPRGREAYSVDASVHAAAASQPSTIPSQPTAASTASAARTASTASAASAASATSVLANGERTIGVRDVGNGGAASLPLALLLALAGGVILNLMPCVFPVLSLKVLSFIEQAGHDSQRVRVHGWVFTLGVLVSFWALAGALLLLRAGGESLGWGFQLQSPAFLAGLCAVLLLFALSLSGVFEVGLSLTGVTSAHIEASRGYAASFWTGALATVIATPCTAPFMGTALGYALTQPAHVALLVFTALGLGMAAPYLVLSYAPGLLKRLPRPGAWMDSFRQLMAFPLYATVLWLLYVFSRQTSAGAMWQLMTALLLLAVGAWAWGVAQRLRRRARLPVVLAWVATAAALVVGFSAATRTPALDAGNAVAQTDGFWQAWSPARLEDLRSQDRPVFVNFTADWCLSCQVNERVVFASDDVRELFRTHDVTALKADWTNEDARIAEALAAFGRDGVPLYVYYPAGGAAPRILPQVPTHGSLREAFASAASVPKPEPKEKNRS